MTDDAPALRLQRFATDLLAWRGALVEWPPGADAGMAVLPEAAAAALGTEEEARLSARPVPGGLTVSLATDFLDRVEALLAEAAPTAAWRLREAYLKKADPAETVAKAFDWPNARVRTRSSRACEAEYHVWFFRALLVSEDRWEDVVRVSLNVRSGAEIELPDLAGGGGGDWVRHPGAFDAEATWARAGELAWRKTRARAAPFLARMDERRQRDRKRLESYYHALLREKRRKRPATADPEAEKDRAAAAAAKDKERRRAVTLELERKTGELDGRYALTGEVSAVGCLQILLPALAIDLSVQRKAAVADRTVYWNPVLKAMEPMACSRCGEPTFSPFFTETRVEPACHACYAARSAH